MPSRPTATQLLDRDFLTVRCRLLDVAAALDRIDRGDKPEAARKDARMSQLTQAARLLADGDSDRARRLQLIFSEPYEAGWRERQAR